MSILDKIIRVKKEEVKEFKRKNEPGLLESQARIIPAPPSFYDALKKTGPALICEFKRKSPSKGILNENADIQSVITSYTEAGASAVSILTDSHFQGSSADLKAAASFTTIPLLRKDFIIDKVQIAEAKILGASAILLIATVLSAKEVEIFTRYAIDLDLEVLLEIHNERELDHISGLNRIVGINNRDLSTFTVDLEHSLKLSRKLPEGVVKVAESGIGSPETVKMLYNSGFNAFLIGEKFMRSANPGLESRQFMEEVKLLLS